MIASVTNDNCYEFRGLSSDKKPVKGIGNGSIFFEMDTAKVFIFDETKNSWKELAGGGSSPTPGGNYTAGPGLVLTGTEFSIDEQIVAKKQEIAVELLKKQDALTAGEGIEIAPNPSTGKLTIKSTGGGNITVGTPHAANDAATKAYVDAAVDSKLKYIANNLSQEQIEVLVAFVQNLTKSEE